MTSAQTERIKLSAAWLNTLAANAIVAGFLAPSASYLYDLTPVEFDGRMVAISAIFLIVGGSLHLAGRSLLGGLDQ